MCWTHPTGHSTVVNGDSSVFMERNKMILIYFTVNNGISGSSNGTMHLEGSILVTEMIYKIYPWYFIHRGLKWFININRFGLVPTIEISGERVRSTPQPLNYDGIHVQW